MVLNLLNLAMHQAHSTRLASQDNGVAVDSARKEWQEESGRVVVVRSCHLQRTSVDLKSTIHLKRDNALLKAATINLKMQMLIHWGKLHRDSKVWCSNLPTVNMVPDYTRRETISTRRSKSLHTLDSSNKVEASVGCLRMRCSVTSTYHHNIANKTK